jgi:hypothetical protein
MPKFEFKPEGHRYLIDGNEWPSVTSVIPKSPHMKNNEEARLKGDYVHSMARLYLLNDLNESTLDDVLKPYLQALKKFLSDSKGMGIQGVIDIKSGAKVATVELQIAGYIELVNHGQLLHDGYNLMGNKLLLEEPFMHPTYQYCGTPDIVIGDYPVKEGHALYLRDNGKYKLETIPNVRRNLETFLCFLNSYKYCKEKGLI